MIVNDKTHKSEVHLQCLGMIKRILKQSFSVLATSNCVLFNSQNWIWQWGRLLMFNVAHLEKHCSKTM